MRLVHTADWHLGRIFYGIHLTEDQAYLLDQFVDLVKSVRPDAVLVSGDVYDRAVPPPEAVALLDDVLSRIVLGLGVPVIAIAGNHDSPERVAFGSRLLARQGLHVRGGPPEAANSPEGLGPVVLEDRYGPVRFYAIPYADPAAVRAGLNDDSVTDHDGALRALLDRVRTGHPAGVRSVVLAHAFVAGGEAAESERPLTVGGAGTVDAGRFEGFTYVALGHLHRAQTAGSERVRYPGSLFAYSFDEAGRPKSVEVVEIDGGPEAEVRAERVELRPRRNVRRVEGFLADLLRKEAPTVGAQASLRPAGDGDDGRPDDYLMVTLLDDGPVLDAMGRLREVYPNVLHIERPALTAAGAGPAASGERRGLDELELFGRFFAEVTGSELTAEQKAVYGRVLERLGRREREDRAQDDGQAQRGDRPEGDGWLEPGDRREVPV